MAQYSSKKSLIRLIRVSGRSNQEVVGFKPYDKIAYVWKMPHFAKVTITKRCKFTFRNYICKTVISPAKCWKLHFWGLKFQNFVAKHASKALSTYIQMFLKPRIFYTNKPFHPQETSESTQQNSIFLKPLCGVGL